MDAEETRISQAQALDREGDHFYVLGQDAGSDEETKRCYKEAAKLYRKAANRHSANAMDSLGNCYYLAHAVEKNHKTAAEWYRKAADNGIVSAMQNLVLCHDRGHGGVTAEEAARWAAAAVATTTAAAGKLTLCEPETRERERDANSRATLSMSIHTFAHHITPYRTSWSTNCCSTSSL
jgi:TPR repeat protein